MKHAILTIVGLTVLFTGTANALVTTTFDDVKAEVEIRLGDLPTEGLSKDQKKEKNSLEKALKTFAKNSTFPTRDMSRVKVIVQTLNKQYPADKKMATLLNSSLDAFEAEVYATIKDTDFAFDYVGKENLKRERAVEKRDGAELLHAEFDAMFDIIAKSKFVKKVNRGLVNYSNATRAALKKQDDLTSHEYGYFVKNKGAYTGAKSCMKCHKKEARHMLKAGHWKWEAVTANVEGFEKEVHGKNDIINNFCIAIPSNEARCTQCHPGYGYRDQKFKFKDANALDCLICHDTTGTYKKDPKQAGAPVAGIDFRHVALNVGAPTRENCGSCHFSAGGGDNVKKGDLGSALIAEDITSATDVHMGGKGSFSCQKCHVTVDHKIPGNQIQDTGRVDCQDCHDTTKLSSSIHRDSHVAMMACQTCHIPTFSRQQATKIHWDWSTAGDKDRVPVNDVNGKPDYNFMKGDFVWGKNVAPKLMWYNGTWTKTFIGANDKSTDISEVFVLSTPLGTSADGKIYPFKEMTGLQPVDAANGTILVPHLFGPGDPTAYWTSYDWDTSLASGALAAGQTYTGSYDWIKTVQYLSINHEVAPRTEALGAASCDDCHGGNDKNFPWTDLGVSKPF